jgi:hypothetical protein
MIKNNFIYMKIPFIDLKFWYQCRKCFNFFKFIDPINKNNRLNTSSQICTKCREKTAKTYLGNQNKVLKLKQELAAWKKDMKYTVRITKEVF